MGVKAQARPIAVPRAEYSAVCRLRISGTTRRNFTSRASRSQNPVRLRGMIAVTHSSRRRCAIPASLGKAGPARLVRLISTTG
ncbi:hypothetical protein DLREEDagr8_34450 [Dongia sp. agr-C8]